MFDLAQTGLYNYVPISPPIVCFAVSVFCSLLGAVIGLAALRRR